MKNIIFMTCILFIVTACNFKENLKEVGDGVQQGAQNAVEAAKELPADISEASNKAEKDIRE